MELILKDAFKFHKHIYGTYKGDLFMKVGKFLITYLQPCGNTEIYGIGFFNKALMDKEFREIMISFDSNNNNVGKGTKTNSITIGPDDMNLLNFASDSENKVEFTQLGGAYTLMLKAKETLCEQRGVIKMDENMVRSFTHALRNNLCSENSVTLFFNLIDLTNSETVDVFVNFENFHQNSNYEERDFDVIFNINSARRPMNVTLLNKLLSLENVRLFFDHSHYDHLQYILANVPKSLLWPLHLTEISSTKQSSFLTKTI